MQKILLTPEKTNELENFSLPVMVKLIEMEYPGNYTSLERSLQIKEIFNVEVSEDLLFEYYNLNFEDIELENRQHQWKLELT